MKKAVLVSLLLFIGPSLFSQDTIYSIAYNFPQPFSNFEDRDSSNYFFFAPPLSGNIWQVGTPSKAVFNSAYSPTLALLTDTANTYPGGTLSSFEFVIKTDDETSISFKHRCNSDTLQDGGVVELSTDNGVTWTNVINAPGYNCINFYNSSSTISSNGGKRGFSGNYGWKQSTINHAGGLNFVRFRFTFSSEFINTNRDGWMIDDFAFSCIGTGIHEDQKNNSVNIFPNPSSGVVNVKVDPSDKVLCLFLKDVAGKIVLSGNDDVINLDGLEPGIYFIDVITDNERSIKKVIKN